MAVLGHFCANPRLFASDFVFLIAPLLAKQLQNEPERTAILH